MTDTKSSAKNIGFFGYAVGSVVTTVAATAIKVTQVALTTGATKAYVEFRAYADEKAHTINKAWFEKNWPKDKLDAELTKITKLDAITVGEIFEEYKKFRSITGTPTDYLINLITRINKEEANQEAKERKIANAVTNYINQNKGRGFCVYLVKNITSLINNSYALKMDVNPEIKLKNKEDDEMAGKVEEESVCKDPGNKVVEISEENGKLESSGAAAEEDQQEHSGAMQMRY